MKKEFGKFISYECKGNLIELTFSKGNGYIKFVSEGIVKICDDADIPSFAVKDVMNTDVLYAAEKKETLKIKTDNLIITVDDEFRVGFYTSDEKEICLDTDQTTLHNDSLFSVVKKMHPDECFYGLGDASGFLNKRGYEYEMWNSDIPDTHTEFMKSLYKSIPFFIGIHSNLAYGIFFDTTFRTFFNMGKESDEYYYIACNEGRLNYYFLYGKTFGEIVKDYTFLTGRTPLPQIWTLGYQQSRWSYKSEADIRLLAVKFLDHKIPIDAIHLDIDYMDRYKVFTVSKENFPNFQSMIQDLKKEGIRIVTIIDPGVKAEPGYPVYDEGMENGYFAKKNESVYVNAVWPGDAVFPDFLQKRVRVWWGEKVKKLLNLGISGIWNDMNEPASFKGPLPDDVIFSDENRCFLHKEIHNVYGHLMAEATYDAYKDFLGKRPFVITRACFSGTQKYAVVWTGDNQSIWAHLKMAIPQICNLNLSGLPFCGCDIGGFGYDTTKELLLRWIEAACFFPLFRNHSAIHTRHQEPWCFDQETIDIYRKYVMLRYRFIPYLYDLFYKHTEDGSPIIRPLVYHYSEDENTHQLNDEYLVGENLLVAPILDQGTTNRLVYLPKGTWIDYWTNSVYSGESYYIVNAPLDTLPLFAKEDSILVSYETKMNTDQFDRKELIVDIYGESADYIHYLDDGESFDFENGSFQLYRFRYQNHRLRIDIANEGQIRYEKIIVRHNGNTVIVSGIRNIEIEI